MVRTASLRRTGHNNAVDPASGTVLWSVAAVAAVDPSGATPRPSLTVGETIVCASDSTRGTVVRLDLATGSPAGPPIQVGGSPSLLTLVTLDGVRH